MEKKFDKAKTKEAFSNFFHSSVDFGKKAAADAKAGFDTMVEKSKSDSYAKRKEKLNPLFPDEYNSESFKIPNVIMIVDDAVRRDIDVCEGAIGWRNSDSGVEILYLYDEFVESSGLTFIPTATCDAIYCVDCFDHKRFIRTDCIFSKAHEERMAELEHVAYCLGAKRCTIDIAVSKVDMQEQSKSINLSEKIKGVKLKESVEQSSGTRDAVCSSGHIEIDFQGHDAPQKPQLKWFAHDDTINRLIEVRCNDKNAIKQKTLELAGSSCATMSHKTACAIDIANTGGGISMKAKATEEHNSTLFYYVEF